MGKNVHCTFLIKYQLSVGQPLWPSNLFPAALIDVLAGYNYLVDIVSFNSMDVIIVGDSAGNLALVLVQYLIECQKAGKT